MSITHFDPGLDRAPAATIPERWRRHPFLARLECFAVLSDRDRAALWRLIEAQLTVKKRTDLIIDGYEYRKLCFVEKGFAASYKLLRNGRRQIINFVLPGDVVGLPGSFLQRAGYSVVALTDVKLQVCSAMAYCDLCYKRPQFGLVLSWLALQEAITCGEHVINNGRRTPLERLAHFLLELHSRLAMVGHAAQLCFELPFSQEVMSDALGLSVPHLNRTLSKLRGDGLIAVRGRQVELTDYKALEVLAHFQPLNFTRIPAPRMGTAIAG
jgi:CRP-like cAMP-binding protein